MGANNRVSAWATGTISVVVGALVGWGIAFIRLPSAASLHAEALQRFERGDPAAESTLRHCIALHANDSASRLSFAHFAARAEAWPSIPTVLSGVDDRADLGFEARMMEGDAWYRLQRARDAKRCWLAASALRPDDIRVRKKLTAIAAFQLRREEWMRLLWDLFDRGAADVPELVQLTVCDHIVWDSDSRPDGLKAMAEADARDLASRLAYGIHLGKTGKFDAAARVLRELVDLTPDHFDVHEAWAELNLSMDSLVTARTAVSRCAELAPDSPAVMRLRGLLAFADRDHATACGELRKSVEFWPFDLEVNHRLATALRLAGREPEAVHFSEVAACLARVERECHTLQQVVTREPERIARVVAELEWLGLAEEASGWVKAGLKLYPADIALQAAAKRTTGSLPPSPRRRYPDRRRPWAG